ARAVHRCGFARARPGRRGGRAVGVTAIGADALARLTDPEIRRFLDEKWELVEELFAPVHAIFFGSRVNGTPHEDSDIDLILVSDRFAEIRFVKRKYTFKTSIRPHIRMDVFCYTPQEFEKLSTGIGVIADACREGVWLK